MLNINYIFSHAQSLFLAASYYIESSGVVDDHLFCDTELSQITENATKHATSNLAT